MCIMIFAVCPRREYAATPKRDRQAKCLAAQRHAQPAPAGRAPSAVPEQRFLRPGRHRSGQVRDAPPGPCRPPAGFPGRRPVWVFSTLVLSGRLRLRTSWVGRVDSVEERPQKRPQTHAGSDGVPTRNAKSGAVAELRATGRPREEEIRRPGSSPEHRAATPAGKKTPLNSVPAPTATSLSSGALVAAYEELRRQVLLNRHGPGATLLRRRGVWAWISVCSAGSAALPTKAFTQSEADPIIPQGLHTEIVVMLAGMLLGRYQEASA